MGFLKTIFNYKAVNSIDRNGLPRGTHSDCCERCCFRVKDPSSSYLICAARRVHVGANQICDDFERGQPRYEIN